MNMMHSFLSAASESGAVSHTFVWIAGVAGGGLLLYILFRWIKRVTAKYDARFVQSMVDDIAGWLSQEGLMRREEAQTELQRVFDGSPNPSFLENLLSLECKFVQTAPSTCNQTTTLVFRKGERVHETTFARSVPWDYLPSAIRREFIMNNPKEIDYDFLKAQKKG